MKMASGFYSGIVIESGRSGYATNSNSQRQRQYAGERPQVLDVFGGVDRLELGSGGTV